MSNQFDTGFNSDEDKTNSLMEKKKEMVEDERKSRKYSVEIANQQVHHLSVAMLVYLAEIGVVIKDYWESGCDAT